MKISRDLLQYMRACALHTTPINTRTTVRPWSRPCISQRIPQHTNQRRMAHDNPGDKEDFTSIVDLPPQLVRVSNRRGIGTYMLAIIPLTAFALGCWQVQRLGWKSDLIARFEDRLIREPLPLPPSIDPAVVPDFDYRRVYAVGTFRHDQEMLVGPRLLDGEDGYQVITPLERTGGSKILINRGWISKTKKEQASRPRGLPTGEIAVHGLLREPFKKNMFTPDNVPEKSQFYFPDIEMMARLTGSQPVWIETTMHPDLITTANRTIAGIPVGRPAEVNLRNNHTQYIFTWFSLALATTVMFGMVVRRPHTAQSKVRATRVW